MSEKELPKNLDEFFAKVAEEQRACETEKEVREHSSMGVICVRHHKYDGNRPTGAEILIYEVLINRGFVIDSMATANGKDPEIGQMTLVLRSCGGQKLEQARLQIEKIVTVIRADIMDPDRDVVQYIRARVHELIDDERIIIRKDYGANIDEVIRFEVPERNKRLVSRWLAKQKTVKLISTVQNELVKGGSGEGGKFRWKQKFLVRNLGGNERGEMLGKLGGQLGPKRKALVSMQASVGRVEALRCYLVDQFGERLHDGDLRVQAPQGVLLERRRRS